MEFTKGSEIFLYASSISRFFTRNLSGERETLSKRLLYFTMALSPCRLTSSIILSTVCLLADKPSNRLNCFLSFSISLLTLHFHVRNIRIVPPSKINRNIAKPNYFTFLGFYQVSGEMLLCV